MDIKVKLLDNFKELEIPKYETKFSAGMDLRAAIDSDIILTPMERKLVKTGIAIELPINYEAQIRPRSGLALKYGISILNSPGTIDSDYRGEIAVIMANLSQDNFTIKRGDRIAQMIIARFEQANLIISNNLSDSDRGSKGFGSTGNN